MAVREVRHYVDQVQSRFPILSKSEINKIITYGLKRYAWANRMHCDILFKNLTDEPMVAYCGRLALDSLKHYFRWIVKWRMKERVLYKLRRTKWDGYYYIGLTDEQHAQFKKKKKYFYNVYLTKIENELHHNKLNKHIWRVPWIEDCGWKFFVKKLNKEKAEYRGENNYEKYHQCFLGRHNNGSESVDNAGNSFNECS